MIQKDTRVISWVVQSDAASCDGISIEAFLRAKGCSHHVLTHLKRTDHGILQNSQWAYANQPVRSGDTVTICLKESEPSTQILPVPLPLRVIYEDEDVLVVDKPEGMPVHPSAGNYENTLANAVMYYYTSRGIPFAFRCITRLDRDTTGLVLIAKNSLSGSILSGMAAKRQIHREYLAVTEGLLPESGTISAPIARLDGSPLMRCIDETRGERAVTHYRRLCSFSCPRHTESKSIAPTYCQRQVNSENAASENSQCPARQASAASEPGYIGAMDAIFSLASIRLETGRTHQIRVHMKSIGHPLPGDFLYNPDSVCALTPRQMLHSHRISFTHPITGETLEFVSEMPKDMVYMFRFAKQIENTGPAQCETQH